MTGRSYSGFGDLTMEARKLSVSEIGRCVMLSRLLWSGAVGPRRAKVNMDLTDHVNLIVAGSKVRRSLALKMRKNGDVEKMRRCLATAEIVLDTAAQVRNELGPHWMFFEMIIRGNTPRALKRKINPALGIDAECAWDKAAGAIEKACGAGPLAELLTLRT